MKVKLLVGGDGEMLDYYKTFVHDHGLQWDIEFLGYLSDEDVVRYYNFCDVFVLPSTSSVQEGFGLVALEAMACKKPVIISRVVGVAKDVEKQQAGIVIEPENVAALTEALEDVLSNDQKSRRMAAKAYQLVKDKYTWSQHANIVGHEYKKALA